MMQIFAITTRGLEALSAQAMTDIPQLSVREIAYRRVLATYNGPLAALLSLRVVDDVYLLLDTWTGILRQREWLDRIRQYSAQLDLLNIMDILAQVQPIAAPPAFSVTASFVGKRNYTTDEIKQAVAAGVVKRSHWIYQPDDQPRAINLRVFIEHEQALVGVRLSDYPLHQRPYKQVHVYGSTKPSVAAALVRLADIPGEASVLDPCCGAGTILIETALRHTADRQDNRIVGGDINPQAVSASRTNTRLAGVTAYLQRWDARRLPLPEHSVARIITNLPWGRQVTVETDLETDYRAICAEMQRVLSPGGKIVLLANAPQYVSLPGMALENQLEISLFGQNPKILVFADTQAR